jgi:hypothetical protein
MLSPNRSASRRLSPPAAWASLRIRPSRIAGQGCGQQRPGGEEDAVAQAGGRRRGPEPMEATAEANPTVTIGPSPQSGHSACLRLPARSSSQDGDRARGPGAAISQQAGTCQPGRRRQRCLRDSGHRLPDRRRVRGRVVLDPGPARRGAGRGDDHRPPAARQGRRGPRLPRARPLAAGRRGPRRRRAVHRRRAGQGPARDPAHPAARMLGRRAGACAHELMFSLVSTSCAHLHGARATALSSSPSTRVVWRAPTRGFEDAAATFPRRALCQ